MQYLFTIIFNNNTLFTTIFTIIYFLVITII